MKALLNSRKATLLRWATYAVVLAGLVTGTRANAQGAFGLPLEEGTLNSGWLGLMLVDSRIVPGAVEVTGIAPNSPASRAGVQEGDLVVRWNGQSDVRTQIDEVRRLPGDTVRIRISREGQRDRDLTLVAERRAVAFGPRNPSRPNPDVAEEFDAARQQLLRNLEAQTARLGRQADSLRSSLRSGRAYTEQDRARLEELSNRLREQSVNVKVRVDSLGALLSRGGFSSDSLRVFWREFEGAMPRVMMFGDGVGGTTISVNGNTVSVFGGRAGIRADSIAAQMERAMPGMMFIDSVGAFRLRGRAIERSDSVVRELERALSQSGRAAVSIRGNRAAQDRAAVTRALRDEPGRTIRITQDSVIVVRGGFNVFGDTTFTIGAPGGGLGYRLTSSRTGVAGAETTELGERLGSYFGTGTGLLVTRVAPGTPAATAGLQEGDVIVKAGNTAITTVADMRQAIGVARATSLEMEIIRQGRRQTLRLPL